MGDVRKVGDNCAFHFRYLFVKSSVTAQHLRAPCLHDSNHRPVVICKTNVHYCKWARGGVVCRGTMPQAGRSRIRFPSRSLGFKMYLSFHPLTGMSLRNLRRSVKGGRGIRLTSLPFFN
jgi:hypothetical protein